MEKKVVGKAQKIDDLKPLKVYNHAMSKFNIESTKEIEISFVDLLYLQMRIRSTNP